MHRAIDTRQAARVLGGTALIAVLFDLPFRLIGLLGLIPAAGPKNMLPVLFGMLFGPIGAAGAGMGMLLVGAIAQEALRECAAEGIAAFLCGAAAYAVWYRLPMHIRVRCKTGREAKAVLICVAAASVVAALAVVCVPGQLWQVAPGMRAVQLGGSTAVWSLLLGIPCLITATSMFGVIPAAPSSWLARQSDCDAVDLEQTVHNTPESIAGMSDAIDMLALTRGLDMKQVYAMMGCVEELNCLILEQLPANEAVNIQLTASDSLLVRMRYAGARYNPLAIRVEADNPLANVDKLGILLVREMAVYAKHSYANGENRILIIV